MNSNNLLQDFIVAAQQHGEGTVASNPELANTAYSRLIYALKQLHATDSNLDVLSPLLKHENESVRTFAATALLFSTYSREAENFLERESVAKGLIAFSAEMTLTEFKAGRLKPLYEQQVKS